mgnify:CR=1 FL=1
MSIMALYRVSVDIPDQVYSKYGHTIEYDKVSIEATAGADSAGQNAYSTVEEWAIYGSLKEAQACEHRLMDMIYFFAAKDINL